MKTLSIFSAFMLMSITALSQNFEPRFSVALPDSVHAGQVDWLDIDNDGLIDALVIARSVQGKFFLISYKSDTTNGFIPQEVLSLNCTNASYLLADLNIDNAVDVIVSGDFNGAAKTLLLKNQGDFTFMADTLFDEQGTVMAAADLDFDARDELVISGANMDGPFLKILRQTEEGWNVVHDSLKIEASAIHIFDFDKDGRNDIFVSGRDELGQPVTLLLTNTRDFVFQQLLIHPAIAGNSTIADLTPNGRFDLILAGKNRSDVSTTLMLINNETDFDTILDSIPPADTTMLFAADFNLNGKTDVHFYSINHGVDTVNAILDDEGVITYLNKNQLHDQRFGDFDKDGDLDLVQLVGTPGNFQLNLLLDTTAMVNEAPRRPEKAIGSRIFDRYFFWWQRSVDDHTPMDAITYDFSLQAANEEWSLGNFDLINHKRLRVSHGNTGTNNFLLLDSVRNGPINYWIQAIDNTFHAGPEGVCKSNGSCVIDITYTQQPACENEQIVLLAPSTALWFSFKGGFLGESSSLSLQSAAADTVFSFTPEIGECGALNVFVIRPQHDKIREENTMRYVCDSKPAAFSAEPGWAQIEWYSGNKGFISDDESILFSTNTLDTLSLTMTDGNGCGIRRNIALKLSHPVIVADPEIVQILRGEEVQLNVTAGLSEYAWSPVTGLNDPGIFNPVASPQTTTTYTVIAKDSVGCDATAKVHVVVETAAFIPNLFTPNNDGTNDVLKIYGLDNAGDFRFIIHTREGAVVYEAKDVASATSIGWDGTVRGNSQASGVYYWKVEGILPSGRPLLLNGKKSGSIVLLR